MKMELTMTLIIISDDAFLIKKIEEGLTDFYSNPEVIGHCFTADAGIKATALLNPDLVLIDMEMPEIKKRGILSFINQKNTRVIALSSNEGLRKSLNKEGINTIISHPLDMPRLEKLLDETK